MPVGVLFLCLHVGGICAHGGENARSGFGFFAGALWRKGCGYSVGARDYSFDWLGQCLYDGKASTVLLAWYGEGEG